MVICLLISFSSFYIEARNASREEESMLPFQSFMLQEHIKNLKAEIEQYERSMDDDVLINVGKDFENVGKEKSLELSERQQYIISVVKHHPEITIPELAQRSRERKLLRHIQLKEILLLFKLRES